MAFALAFAAVVACRTAIMRDCEVCHAVGHHHHPGFLSDHFTISSPAAR